ncbi:hypothetical protein T06_14353 [Trichinella sp. T6]|nr:hypothetical protein T06_14353 [Trichinella sp. T6]
MKNNKLITIDDISINFPLLNDCNNDVQAFSKFSCDQQIVCQQPILRLLNCIHAAAPTAFFAVGDEREKISFQNIAAKN